MNENLLLDNGRQQKRPKIEYGRQIIEVLEYGRQKNEAMENGRKYVFRSMENGRQKNAHFWTSLDFERHVPGNMHFGRHDYTSIENGRQLQKHWALSISLGRF